MDNPLVSTANVDGVTYTMSSNKQASHWFHCVERQQPEGFCASAVYSQNFCLISSASVSVQTLGRALLTSEEIEKVRESFGDIGSFLITLLLIIIVSLTICLCVPLVDR